MLFDNSFLSLLLIALLITIFDLIRGHELISEKKNEALKSKYNKEICKKKVNLFEYYAIFIATFILMPLPLFIHEESVLCISGILLLFLLRLLTLMIRHILLMKTSLFVINNKKNCIK